MAIELRSHFADTLRKGRSACSSSRKLGVGAGFCGGGQMSGWGVAMELLNIEIDQESQQEAIYHVLLLPNSITIWPIVHRE